MVHQFIDQGDAATARREDIRGIRSWRWRRLPEARAGPPERPSSASISPPAVGVVAITADGRLTGSRFSNSEHTGDTLVPSNVDREALARPLVDDREAFQPLAIRAPIEDEIVRPDMISSGRRHGSRASARDAPAWPAARHLQPGLPPEAMRAVGAHRVACAARGESRPSAPQ